LLLTRFVARALDRLPLVLLTTRRTGVALDDAAARLLDDLESEAALVALHGFELHETSAFVSAHGGGLDGDRLEAVHTVTGGNPLVLRRLLSRGTPADPQALADGLRSTISEALQRLGPGAAHVLELSAVLGRSASIHEVAAVAGASPAAVLEVLREAERE